MNEAYDDLAVTNTTAPAPSHEIPAMGEHQAVLAQAHNIGHEIYMGRPDTDPKAVLIFELDQKMTGGQMNGKPMILSMRVPMNMAVGSKLRMLVDGWRAPKPPMTDDEAKAFTIRKLLNAPCTVLVVHKLKKDKSGMRADIQGVMRAKDGAPRVTVTYTEVPKWVAEEKEKNAGNKPAAPGAAFVPASQGGAGAPPPEDDLPF